MRVARKVLFWTHLALGVVAGVVILIMSVTGALLAFERQVVGWGDRSYRVTPSGNHASAASMVTTAAGYAPDAKPATLTLRADPAAPASVSIGKGRTLFIDPYTGAALGLASTGSRELFGTVEDVHRWLALKDASRATARKVTGWSNVAFFLILTGPFLWIPRRWTWRQVRNVLFFRRTSSGKARDFNWHHVFGIWTAIPLFLIVASGVVISFPWASALVYRAVGETPPARNAAPPGGRGETQKAPPLLGGLGAELDTMLVRAARDTPGWRTVSLSLPVRKPTEVVVNIDKGDGGQPQLRQSMTFDGTTGAVMSRQRFADQSTGRRLRSILRFTHTGEVLGLFGQTIAAIASLAAAILVWTGLASSFRRLRARLRSGPRRSPVGGDAPETVRPAPRAGSVGAVPAALRVEPVGIARAQLGDVAVGDVAQ